MPTGAQDRGWVARSRTAPASASALPRILLTVSEIDVQVVEDAQYLEGVGLHPAGNQGDSHRTWQGHPAASLKRQIQIVNPRSAEPPSFLVSVLRRGGAERKCTVH